MKVKGIDIPDGHVHEALRRVKARGLPFARSHLAQELMRCTNRHRALDCVYARWKWLCAVCTRELQRQKKLGHLKFDDGRWLE